MKPFSITHRKNNKNTAQWIEPFFNVQWPQLSVCSVLTCAMKCGHSRNVFANDVDILYLFIWKMCHSCTKVINLNWQQRPSESLWWNFIFFYIDFFLSIKWMKTRAYHLLLLCKLRSHPYTNFCWWLWQTKWLRLAIELVNFSRLCYHLKILN